MPGRAKEGQVTVLHFYQEYCSGGHEAEDENRSIFYEREDEGSEEDEDDIESSFKDIFPNITPVKP